MTNASSENSASQSKAYSPIIDFHTHVFPPLSEGVLKSAFSIIEAGVETGMSQIPEAHRTKVEVLSKEISHNLNATWQDVRTTLREAFAPVARYSHELQTQSSTLPPGLRELACEVGNASAFSHLILESSDDDQLRAMNRVGIDFAVTVAQPPFISSEYVVKLADDDSRRVAAVALTYQEGSSEDLLRDFHEEGVRILKIDFLQAEIGRLAEFYTQQLKFAAENGWIVILQQSRPIEKRILHPAEQNDASQFEPWLESFPELPFVLMDSGSHKIQNMIDLAKRYQNLSLTTAMKPADVIAQISHAIGAERVLFASDWPVYGENMNIGVSRVRELEDNALLTAEQASMILGGNAYRLLHAAGFTRPFDNGFETATNSSI